jgi:hypothetical protein
MKLDEFISDILITTGSKKDYRSWRKNRKKDIAITKPYKGTRPENQSGSFFGAHSPKNDRTLGFQPCDNIEADDACAIARLSTETCTVKLL